MNQEYSLVCYLRQLLCTGLICLSINVNYLTFINQYFYNANIFYICKQCLLCRAGVTKWRTAGAFFTDPGGRVIIKYII